MPLRSQFHIMGLALTFVTAAAPLCHAAEGSITWTVEAGPMAEHFAYEEFADTGARLDRESGWLPGVRLKLSGRMDDWEGTLEADLVGGRADYDGQTNVGTPLATRTDERIGNVSLVLARWIASGSAHPFALYGGLGWRGWDRDIRATAGSAGLREQYYWGYGIAGARLVVARTDTVEVELDVAATRMISPRIRIEFDNNFDSTTLALGVRNGWRAALPVRWQLAPASQLRFEPFYERITIGRSPTSPLTVGGSSVGTLYEPHSTTRASGVAVTWAHTF